MKQTLLLLIFSIFLLSGCLPASVEITSNEPYAVVDYSDYITISAVGDCTLGSDVNYLGKDSFVSVYNNLGGDSSYFFKNVRHLLENDDLTIINFEGTLSEQGRREDKEYAFRGNPEYVNILTSGSVEAANLANNHTMDYGEAAFDDTKDILYENGILWFEGKNFAIKNVNGFNVGLIGTNFLHGKEKRDFCDNLKKLKSYKPDLIIASFHWGTEKTTTPNAQQIEYAHMAIDNGADLVIGHHPHVLQGIEKYQGKYIVYSLGNFCFGGSRTPADKDTMIFRQTFRFTDDKLMPEDDVSVIPCSVSSITKHNNFQPTPLDGEDFDRVKNKIIDRSSDFPDEIKFIKG